MDTDKLTSEEVQSLIKEIKDFSNNVSISIPLMGKYKLDEEVVGDTSNIEYRFHIYRGNLKAKYSLHIRFFNNNIHLVRLCINGSRHNNYDGTKISRNHIHIYKFVPSKNQVVEYAYDLSNFPFNEKDELEEAVTKFSKYINLKT